MYLHPGIYKTMKTMKSHLELLFLFQTQFITVTVVIRIDRMREKSF